MEALLFIAFIIVLAATSPWIAAYLDTGLDYDPDAH